MVRVPFDVVAKHVKKNHITKKMENAPMNKLGSKQVTDIEINRYETKIPDKSS